MKPIRAFLKTHSTSQLLCLLLFADFLIAFDTYAYWGLLLMVAVVVACFFNEGLLRLPKGKGRDVLNRLNSMRSIMTNKPYILILPRRPGNITVVRSNIAHSWVIIQVMVDTADELNKAEEAGESLINQLGIKTQDRE